MLRRDTLLHISPDRDTDSHRADQAREPDLNPDRDFRRDRDSTGESPMMRTAALTTTPGPWKRKTHGSKTLTGTATHAVRIGTWKEVSSSTLKRNTPNPHFGNPILNAPGSS